jgi:circadian clock protein KaiC
MAQNSVSTGIDGLDRVLMGGLPRDRLVLVGGGPGTGKTTLALQFLNAGVTRGERGLFFSLAQTEEELAVIATAHGLGLDGVDVRSPMIGEGAATRSYSVETAEAELVDLIREIHRALDEVAPDLFVFDSLLELRLLATSTVRYRYEVLALRRLLRSRRVTSLLLDHIEPEGVERHAEGIVHGVVRLFAETPAIGIMHRRLAVLKMRGAPFVEGYHDVRLKEGGVEVFPRVIPQHTEFAPPLAPLRTGKTTLDAMLGGGLDYGMTMLVAGQAGSGKSTLATVVAKAAAAAGVRAGLFLFEERQEVFRNRSAGVGLDLASQEAAGLLQLSYYDPAEISPGEFSHAVIDAVEHGGMRVVVIDSLSGYLKALPNRENTATHLFQLLKYLARRGVLVVVTLAQHGLLNEPSHTEIDSSYLADAIVLLRQYEAGATIQRSIAVMKRRQGPHERMIQEFVIRDGAVEVRALSPAEAAEAGTASRLGTDAW